METLKWFANNEMCLPALPEPRLRIIECFGGSSFSGLTLGGTTGGTGGGGDPITSFSIVYSNSEHKESKTIRKVA